MATAKKVSGQTRTEVKDKLKALHSELDAGVRSTAAYTVEKAVADWLAEGLPGRTAKTVEVSRDSLRPLLADTPDGLEGRPSQSLTLAEATALLTGVRSEEARALTWEHVDLEAGTISACRGGDRAAGRASSRTTEVSCRRVLRPDNRRKLTGTLLTVRGQVATRNAGP